MSTQTRAASATLIIDTSYTSFYCFFKTKRWHDKQYPERRDVVDWHLEKTFMERYETNYLKLFDNIMKKNLIEWADVVFVKDCYRDCVWRRSVYSEYKATREKNNRHFTGGLVFKETHARILPKFEERGAKMIKVATAEADDIIAVLCGCLRDSRTILLVSKDSDYFQLVEPGRIYLINVHNKLLKNRYTTGHKQADLLYKILNGDKSDNVPGCLSRSVTKKMCVQLSRTDAALQDFLDKKKCRETFERNQRLLDLAYVPASIREEVTTWCRDVFSAYFKK